jgi:TolA-binding protein
MKDWMIWLVISLGLLLVVSCAQLPDDQLIAKGKAFEEEGKFDEAIKTFRKVARKYSKSPLCAEAHYHIALVQSNGLQKFPEAITTFESVHLCQ